jgi:ADP-ribose pyrophosphatase
MCMGCGEVDVNKPKKCGEEKTVFEGRMFELVKQPMDCGGKIKEFNLLRRSPGVRALIVKDGKILLTKEWRVEFDDWDYRMAGGKVFDTLKEYKSGLSTGKDILEFAKQALIRECKEEVGVIVKNAKYIYTSICGATIKHDLFFFLVDEFSETGKQELEAGEVIYPEWFTFKEAWEMCLDGRVKQDRTAAPLMRFLVGNV